MKKTVWTYGLISGAVAAALMLVTLTFAKSLEGRQGEVVGYTGIVLSGLLVFFGIRSYRENVGGGSISFGRALAVGSLIALISACFYVVTWELIYYVIAPDFAQQCLTGMLDRIKESGKPQAEINAELARMSSFLELYRNPLVNVAFTFLEPLPVGLLIALISAAILRQKTAGFRPAATTD